MSFMNYCLTKNILENVIKRAFNKNTTYYSSLTFYVIFFLIDKLFVASFLKKKFKDENYQRKWVLDARLGLYPLKAEIKDKAGSRWHFRTPPVIKPNMFEAKKDL